MSQISRMVSSNTPWVRRIGDHQAARSSLCASALALEIGDVDVAVGVAGDGDDLHAGHDGAGGIGAVRGGGNQADVAMALAARFVIGADDEQAGVFALRAGVGLERNAGEAGDFREPVFEMLERCSGSRAVWSVGANGCSLPNSGQVHGKHLARWR